MILNIALILSYLALALLNYVNYLLNGNTIDLLFVVMWSILVYTWTMVTYRDIKYKRERAKWVEEYNKWAEQNNEPIAHKGGERRV